MGLLAEQIVIDCPPSRLEELLTHRPATWMVPLLRLAGDEGEAAGLALLGEPAGADRRQSPRRPEHELEMRPAGRTGAAVRVDLRWRARDYRVLFAELEGTIELRPLDGHSVVGIEGCFVAPRLLEETGLGAVASRRAAESAARSLLGHLRAAVEVVHVHQEG